MKAWSQRGQRGASGCEIGCTAARHYVRLQGRSPRCGARRVDHLVHNPSEITLEQSGDQIKGVAVVDRSGARQVVRLREPLVLPSAGTTASRSQPW